MDTGKTQNTGGVTDWGNEMYSGLSGVGTFTADLTMVIALIIGSVMIVVGIWMVATDDDDRYLRIQGSVTQPNCTKTSTSYDDKGKPTDQYKCNIVVAYKLDNNVYSKTIYMNGSSSYIVGEPISLMVSRSDHNDVQVASMSKGSTGCALFVVAPIIVALAYLNYYLTHNYRVYAAATGTKAIVGLFR